MYSKKTIVGVHKDGYYYYLITKPIWALVRKPKGIMYETDIEVIFDIG